MASTTATDTESFLTTPRTTLKRHPERGSHEQAQVHAIIDEALYCHVGFVLDGTPCVLPTAHARIDDTVYLHGARGNRMLRALLGESGVAVTFTLIDGLVFARSAFHHSMNYRSVALFGRAIEVTGLDEKRAALTALVEHLAKGRSREVRMPSDDELRTTLVVRVPIAEASAKVRSGPPVDLATDLEHPCWAGVLPVRVVAGAVTRDPTLSPSTLIAGSVAGRAAAMGSAIEQPLEWQHNGYLVSTDRSRLDLALVHRFLCEESYWARGITEAELNRSIEHSICFGLYAAGQQIGFARVTTDFARIAHLADVFVLEPHRKQKLGSWLLECVLAHPELESVRWLLGTRGAHGFYARFGFRGDEEGRIMGRAR
jgi:nitroimidazol reductase NimA-like FMN-containing flavoprotein (pyridoxamine 5'-phosphate oxidase superfamily)/GNAT superfamily N-acetyltransferase